MAEKYDVKLRECQVCKQQIESTAKGIKDHARTCGTHGGVK